MPKMVNVRLYEVRRKKDNKVSFQDALQSIANLSLDKREDEMDEDLTIRLERHSAGPTVTGELVRLQGYDLPGKASKGKALEKLGVDSIGHSSVFAYNASTGIIAFQIARNGITAPLFGHYVGEMISSSSYLFLPILTKEAWQTMKSGRVRGLKFRVSSPDELQAIDAETQAVRSALRQMKETMKTSQIEITMSMKRGDPDVGKARSTSLLRWLLGEHDSDRGGLSSLGANVIPEGDEGTTFLNLIEGHEGSKESLDLPSDDPDSSYQIRLAFARKLLRQHHQS